MDSQKQLNGMNRIEIPVPIGELIDKITILRIKCDRITDNNKIKNIVPELIALQNKWEHDIIQKLPKHIIQEVDKLCASLAIINNKLWDIEDEIRHHEKQKLFDANFITLARNVYINNDQRALIKRQINELCGSEFLEEKSYTTYE